MTDDEIREEVRRKFSHAAQGQHPDWLHLMCEQAVNQYHERLAENERLLYLQTLSTWEPDDHPHHSHSSRCLGCGRWLIEHGDSGWGPYWVCPAPCGVNWNYRFHDAKGDWKNG